jgi:hypothetical protein
MKQYANLLGALLNMEWLSHRRKAAGILLIFSGLFNVYVLIFVLWDLVKFDFDIGFSYLDFIDFWAPAISSVVSLFFITLGVIAAFKGKTWWLAATASVISLLTPIIWQMFPTTGEAYVVIPRVIAFSIGIIVTLIIILARKDFKRFKTEREPSNITEETKITG